MLIRFLKVSPVQAAIRLPSVQETNCLIFSKHDVKSLSFIALECLIFIGEITQNYLQYFQ